MPLLSELLPWHHARKQWQLHLYLSPSENRPKPFLNDSIQWSELILSLNFCQLEATYELLGDWSRIRFSDSKLWIQEVTKGPLAPSVQSCFQTKKRCHQVSPAAAAADVQPTVAAWDGLYCVPSVKKSNLISCFRALFWTYFLSLLMYSYFIQNKN